VSGDGEIVVRPQDRSKCKFSVQLSLDDSVARVFRFDRKLNYWTGAKDCPPQAIELFEHLLARLDEGNE
jgi:hypothetical protein